MEKRKFGRTGHLSTIAIFGAAAFWEIEQKGADTIIEMVIEAGINHIDVAPSYGQAEERIGPWMPRERQRFFLGCKTMERTKEGAWDEMQQSFKRLQTDHFDLYQLHAVTSMEELDACTMQGGALEAVVEARQQGLIRHIGITGHGVDVPRLFVEALKRFDFDSVTFPLNFVQMSNPKFRKDAEALIALCQENDVGTMIIKTVTKGPWGEKEKTATTWYEPFDQQEEVQNAVNFALSYEVTGLCTAGDIKVLPMVLNACQNFSPMNDTQREAMIKSGQQLEPLFT
jgi:aryl-alcohol dehydrogenase-like predicted oxidoreductase